MSRSTPSLRNFHHVTIILGLILAITNYGIGKSSHGASRNVTSHQKCKTDACQLTALEIIDKMNDTVNPCDDFYQFACGRYLSGYIPPYQDEYDVTSHNEDEIGERLRLMIEKSTEMNEPKAFKKLRDYYNNCLKREEPDDTGDHDLKKLFKELGGWPLIEGSSWDESEFNWKQMMTKFRKVGLNNDHFIRIVVVRNDSNTSKKIFYIDPPGFDPPHPELGNLSTQTLRLTLDKMAELTKAFGIDSESAIDELEKVALFMVDLYQISSMQSTNPDSFRNFSSIGELQTKYPAVEWLSYINGILPLSMQAKKSDGLVIFNPEYFSRLDYVISNAEKRTLANYIFYREAETFSRYTKIWGTNSMSDKDNAVFCMNEVSTNLPYALSVMYVKEYFDEEKMPIMEKLVYVLKEEYQKVLNQMKWMDNTTKARAGEKLRRMESFVGHSKNLLDYVKLDRYYDNLMIHSQSFLKTQLNVVTLTNTHRYKEMMDTYDKQDWFRKFSNSFSTLVHYSPITNKLLVPTGFFQKLVNEKTHPRYMRFGFFGPHIAHEITHGLDRDGDSFDENGQPNYLWTSNSDKKYTQVAKCVDKQYETYISERYNLAGKSDVITNIADYLGVKTAYAAYKTYLMLNGGNDYQIPGLEDYFPEQMFWIAYASSMCTRYTTEGLKKTITKGEKVISEYRVLGSISNNPDFLKDFGCKPDTWTYQVNKCDI